MSTLRPFRALRPSVGLAQKVASPPYDVVSSAEARALAEGNVDSFLRVSRPEIDLPTGTDEHADVVYTQAVVSLNDLVGRGTLVEDAAPRLWIYGQRLGRHRQLGIVGLASVEEYDAGTIRKHEKTRPDKEDDRTRHIDTLAAHDEPVFLTYRANAAIDEIVGLVTAAKPTEDFETSDGVGHTIWAVGEKESAVLVAAFAEQVPHLYVADGHHRSAAASRVHAKRSGVGDTSEHDAFLVVVFPHDQMQILPYNRLVRDEQARSAAELLQALSARFDIVAASSPDAPRKGSFSVFLGGCWYHASVRAGSFDPTDPVASLDCSLVQDQLLAPVFGIVDPRRDARIDFVGGIRGAAEIERRVAADGFSLGLVLYPTSIDELLAVSDRDLLMPPKSTWFEPKLRSGLFAHRFAPSPVNPGG